MGLTVRGKTKRQSKLEAGKGREMDNATFGMTVTLVGMGGTLLTLWLISLMIVLLKKIFPLPDDENATNANR